MQPMPEPQDQFTASIASEAVEVLEDHLLFPGGYLLPLSARGSGVPSIRIIFGVGIADCPQMTPPISSPKVFVLLK